MKVLLATSLTNGERADDYNGCIEGEVVMLGPICTRGNRDPEHDCEHCRAFGGLFSHESTTTALVSDVGLCEDDVRLAIHSSLSDRGWFSPLSDCQAIEAAADITDVMLDVAEYFDNGTVIGKNADDTFVRRRSVRSF